MLILFFVVGWVLTDIYGVEFKIRISNRLIMNVCLIILGSIMAVWSFFAFQHYAGVLRYVFIPWAIIALMRFSNYGKYLYTAVKGSPALIINENYIYDVVNNIKYNWKDIEEVYEENSYLYIDLCNPGNYAANISNPIKKMQITAGLGDNVATPFKINIDVVNVDRTVLLELLDKYSIQATETE